ncbi:disease resistance protein RPV1 [Cryptomeria japonica]|uniref:disease resistance protein RPV1 n=1 Tax=Cryptomeria japonica TaxID=3369 RepID=UPI0025AD0DF5|nr:disease resistance protein RPV1 [Cryptomeria japonica]
MESGRSGLHGLETLMNKCLVELVEEEVFNNSPVKRIIRMHDQHRDMGREIASRQLPYRLWCPQQIDNLKKHSKIRKAIRGIQPANVFVAFKEYTHWLMGNSSRQSKRHRFSNVLQILFVEGNEFTEEFASLSKDLVWLRWEGFCLRNLPSWLTLKNLRVLELRGAEELEELWQDNADPPLQLRELIIWGNRKLQRLPRSIGHLRYLKKLEVAFHGSSLSEEFCDLRSLVFLQLLSPVLSSLPAGFGNLTSLRNISLQFCEQLSMLPDSFSQLINLEVLNLSFCDMLSALPVGFGNLINLRKINLQSCERLSILPDSFKQLIHLENLNLSSCEMLSSLPIDFGNLTSLKYLYLSYWKKLSNLPDFFSQLINLNVLDLSFCVRLSSLPADFGNLTSLRNISMRNCKQLSTFPDSFKQLIHLKDLDLSGCEMLSSLPFDFGNLKSLRNITLQSCKQLSTLPDSFKQLIHLEILDLSGCSKLKLRLDVLENIRKLKELNLSGCKEMEDLPHQIINQTCLTKLYLKGCIKLRGVDLLPVSLKILRIHTCNLLRNIRCISGLIQLEKVQIHDCLQIEELPSLADLASLNTFELWRCPKVEKILGLEHAKSLKIVRADTRQGIHSLEKVERLERLELKCETISAVKPCIQSIKGKEFPSYMWLQGSVIHLVLGRANCKFFGVS